MAVYDTGDAVAFTADDTQPLAARGAVEILVLGGRPIREPVARYGPFVINTREEIVEAVEDFHSGHLIRVTPRQAMRRTAVPDAHRSTADETLG